MNGFPGLRNSTLLIEKDEAGDRERVGTDDEWEAIAEEIIESAREYERAARS